MVFPSTSYPPRTNPTAPPAVTPPSVSDAQDHQRAGTSDWAPFGPTDYADEGTEAGCDK